MRLTAPFVLAMLLPAAAVRGQELDPQLLALEARPIGPAGMSGRVAAIDVVASDPNIVWVGAATGGVFKSTSGGVTWEPMFDKQGVAAIGAIAVNQQNPDLVWVGTGEGNPRNSASVGNGIYKSTDGGKSWQHLGLSASERIHRIVLHPDDPDVAWVAVLGKAWGDSSERGVFQTEDGGRTWRRALHVDERTGCADLAIDPENPRKLFAAMWDYRRAPWFFTSGGKGSGLWVTTDGGSEWTRRTEKDGLPKGELGRIGVAVARSDPNIVYALVEAETSALLRSSDGGRTFKTVNKEHDVASRPFYYCDIRVDPKNPNRIYSLHSTVTVSDDGGKTFSTLIPWSLVHPDHHAMWIHPDNPQLIWEGNDGGVATSTDHGKTWRFVRNLPLAQYYHIAVDNEVPYHVYGGMQDNGSWRGPSSVFENGGIRNHHFKELFFGDGFATVPDPDDATRGYAMSQGGWLGRWDLVTGERRRVRPAGPEDTKLRFNWNAGIAIDPFDPGTVYYGSQFVHRSRDRGASWETISGDLTTNNPAWQKQDESGGLTLDVTAAENYCSILTIAPSPVQHGVIWAGTDDGRVHVTRDGGETFTSVEGNIPGLPAHTWCPHIEASKFDAGTAFCVFDNHRRSDWTPYVYVTRDFGATWQSLASDALRGYVHVLEQDPVEKNLLFLGTEFGLYVSLDQGATWLPYQHGLPAVAVRALVVHPREHDLVIGTHGRAAWIVDDVRPLRGVAAAKDKPFHLFEIAPVQQHRVAQTGEARFPGSEEFRGKTRPYGALLTFWVRDVAEPPASEAQKDAEAKPKDSPAKPAKAKPEPIVIEVSDARGTRVRKFEKPAKRGLCRVVWPLRAEPPQLPRRDDEDDDARGERHGPEVPPGTYRVEARYAGTTVSAELLVRPDPRRTPSEQDYAAKWTAILAARDLADAYGRVLTRIEETRKELALLRGKLADDASADPEDGPEPDPRTAERDALRSALRDTQKSLAAIDEKLRVPEKAKGIPSRDRIGSRVLGAYESLQSSWTAPTTNEQTFLTRARHELESVIAELNTWHTGPLAALRAKVRAAKIELLPERPPLRLEAK